MGSFGSCYDNSLCGFYFASLERELLNRRRFATKAVTRPARFEYIKSFYNTQKRHACLGYISSIDFVKRFKKTALITNRNPSAKTGNIKKLLPHSG